MMEALRLIHHLCVTVLPCKLRAGLALSAAQVVVLTHGKLCSTRAYNGRPSTPGRLTEMTTLPMAAGGNRRRRLLPTWSTRVVTLLHAPLPRPLPAPTSLSAWTARKTCFLAETFPQARHLMGYPRCWMLLLVVQTMLPTVVFLPAKQPLLKLATQQHLHRRCHLTSPLARSLLPPFRESAAIVFGAFWRACGVL